jgi:Protein of unknown function (DUF3096)
VPPSSTTAAYQAFAKYRPDQETRQEARPMTVNIVLLQPIVALLAGILILMIPRLLNFIVAIYLIVIGVAGLWPHLLR